MKGNEISMVIGKALSFSRCLYRSRIMIFGFIYQCNNSQTLLVIVRVFRNNFNNSSYEKILLLSSLTFPLLFLRNST